jgi:LacI family transcriptional regulator
MPPKKKTKPGSTSKNRGAATIYDIAKHTGVSKSTVSRVLTGSKRVDAQTRARVLKAFKDLRFSPNTAARSLSARYEARVGLVYNNPSVAYFTELLMGALDGSSRNGAQLIVERCEAGNMDAAFQAIQKLVEAGLNGIILPTPLTEQNALVQYLIEQGVSAVGVGTSGHRTDISTVDIDNYKAAYEMTDYLIRLGHRRIGFVKGNPKIVSSKMRLQGVKAALQNTGRRAVTSVFVQGLNTYRSGVEAAEQILSNGHRVTAIFANNDDMASGVMSLAHRRGLNVPQDLSVVGFDDTIAGVTWPELTTVRQPIAEIAKTAIDIIMKNLQHIRAGEAPEVRDHLIGHSLIIRDSSAPPPIDR